MRITFFIVLIFSSFCLFADGKTVGWWKFDSLTSQGVVYESVTNSMDSLSGYGKLVKGVTNTALKLDEFSTALKHKPGGSIVLQKSFSIEVWLALQTYPWNWCPLIEQRDSSAGFFMGVDYQGRIGFRLKTENGWFECVTRSAIPGLSDSVNFAGEAGNKRLKAHFPADTYPNPVLPLLAWNHLVATYDAEKQTMALYLNGVKQGETTVKGAFKQALDVDFNLFRSPEKMPLLFVARPKANDPVHTALDGLVDELRVYDEALSQREIQKHLTDEMPKVSKPLNYRRMPTGQDKPGAFGAFYTKLKYDEDWDRGRRTSEQQDIVVRFSNNPCTFVAWNGTIYPILYNETGNAGQQFEAFETWNENGCNEAMMDKTSRYSSWQIIENNPARVVLHWRHALVAFNNKYIYFDQESNWSDWVDDYYYIYPDFVITRKTTLWSSNPLSNFSYAQDNSVMQPEFMPWDIYERNPITIANLKGQVSNLGMGKDRKGVVDAGFELPAQIEVHQFKSTYKPFMIAPPNEQLMGVWTNDEPWPWFFPCWHHWPVAQIHSDGATTFVNNGRPKSSCLTNGWGYGGINKDAVEITSNSLTRFSLIGMTDKPAQDLVPLAKSWRNAPELQILSNGFSSGGYRFYDRAYPIRKTIKSAENLKIRVQASPQRPTANLALVLYNVKATDLSLKLNDKEMKAGETFVLGTEKTLDEDYTIVYVNHRSEVPFTLEIIENIKKQITDL